MIASLDYHGAKFELVIDRPLAATDLDRLSDFATRIDSTVVVMNREIDTEAVVESLPESFRRTLALLAPVETDVRFFSPDEIFRLRSRPALRDLPSAGALQSPSRFFETGVRAKTIFENRLGNEERVRISVVIPFRAGLSKLAACLDSLAHQSLDRPEYEIIVVGDRIPARDLEELRVTISERARDLALSLYALDETGTNPADFRAGLARNAGAFRARGDLLVFLDSDGVAPVEFLEDVKLSHLKSDVVQYRRHDEAREQEEYWTRFYAAPDWMHLGDKWKYVSTFALSVKLADFIAIGGFTTAFSAYGCEDTYLGWALDQRGLRFELRPLTVAHVGGRMRW
ncbi:MAG: glycosyltransferase family 2 protein, partial [Bdellovibrionota bacterium]